MLSNFDRTVRGLSSSEMLECAKILLERLSGGTGSAEAVRPGAAGIELPGRGGTGRAAPAGLYGGERPFRDIEGAAAREPEYAVSRSGSPDARRVWDRLNGESQTRAAGTQAGPVENLRPLPSAASAAAERGGASAAGLPASAGAAFRGPEHRYDPAAGARGAEMSRVSEFFKRDSRRYDSGCSLKQ